MSGVLATLRASVPRPTLRAVATAPLRPRTYGNLLYLALAFPLGLAYFVFLAVGLSLSVGLSFLLVGVPLFVAVLLVALLLVTVERYLVAWLLGVEVGTPDWPFLDREGAVARGRALVLDPAVWTGVVFLATKLAFGTASFVLLLTLLLPAGVLVATPLFYRTPGARVGLFLGDGISRELSLYVPWEQLLVGVSFVVRLSSWEVDTLPEALAMSTLGVIGLILALNVLNVVAWLGGRWARLLLGPRIPALLGRA
jgi:hypothetical protein